MIKIYKNLEDNKTEKQDDLLACYIWFYENFN